MTVYRICASKCPSNDGKGARLHRGRWNHKGTSLLYFGSTISLCDLEVLANSDGLPLNMVAIAVKLPNPISIVALTESDLPVDCNAPVPPLLTKDLGTTWAERKTSLVLSVPSAIVPDERNYIVNPRHPDFAFIRFDMPKPFVFDPRLK